MAYNFTDKDLAVLLNYVFNIVDGHDHDGANSKAVTTGEPAAGSIDKTMFAAGALAADATGRAVIANGFFNAATVLEKFPTDSFSNAVLLQLIADNAFAAAASSRALFADNFMILAKIAATAKTHLFVAPIENLGAGADITARALLEVPAGFTYTITSAVVLSNGTPAGIDAGNTSVVALSDGINAICSATFSNVVAFPAENTTASLGALDGTHKVLAAGEKLTLAVTNGATADIPAFSIQITYTLADA